MADRFDGLVVMITGAASGFGAAAARAMAAEGARLALCDLNPSVCDLGEELGAEHGLVDVSDEMQVAAFMAEVLDIDGRLDIALNNAGIGQVPTGVADTTVEDFDRIMAVNARGVFLGMKHQLPPMIAAGRGAVLNTASAAGVLGAGHIAAYAASKHAVVGMTRAAADEVARHNVRVNALCPSFAETPLFDEMADALGARHGMTREESYTRIAARVPMRRVASVDEVVQAMLWAVDPANSFMTGQAISIDGGLSAV